MKNLYLTLSLCALAATAFSADNNANMRVRFINAVPTASPITVSIGDIPLFSNVQFKQASEWKPLDNEQKAKLVMKTADGKTIQTDEEFKFKNDNEDYTIVVMPSKDNSPSPYVKLYETSQKVPDAAKSNISVINASPSVGSADVTVDADKIHSGVNYSEHKGPDSVAAGNHTIKVTDGRNSDALVGSKTVSTAGGQSYTVLVSGATDMEVLDDVAGRTAESMPNDTAPAATEQTSATETSGMAATDNTTSGDGTMSTPENSSPAMETSSSSSM